MVEPTFVPKDPNSPELIDPNQQGGFDEALAGWLNQRKKETPQQSAVMQEMIGPVKDVIQQWDEKEKRYVPMDKMQYLPDRKTVEAMGGKLQDVAYSRRYGVSTEWTTEEGKRFRADPGRRDKTFSKRNLAKRLLFPTPQQAEEHNAMISAMKDALVMEIEYPFAFLTGQKHWPFSIPGIGKGETFIGGPQHWYEVSEKRRLLEEQGAVFNPKDPIEGTLMSIPPNNLILYGPSKMLLAGKMALSTTRQTMKPSAVSKVAREIMDATYAARRGDKRVADFPPEPLKARQAWEAIDPQVFSLGDDEISDIQRIIALASDEDLIAQVNLGQKKARMRSPDAKAEVAFYKKVSEIARIEQKRRAGLPVDDIAIDPVTGARVAGERNVQETLEELNRLGREADTEHARLIEKQKEYKGAVNLDEIADPIQAEGFRKDIPQIMGKMVRGQELTPDELLVWNKYKQHMAEPTNRAMQLRKQQIDIVEEAQGFQRQGTQRQIEEATPANPLVRIASLMDAQPGEPRFARLPGMKDFGIYADEAIEHQGRVMVIVRHKNGKFQPFYRRTGGGDAPGRPALYATPGEWVPFDGLVLKGIPDEFGVGYGWFNKEKYTAYPYLGKIQGLENIEAHPLMRYGNDENVRISKALKELEERNVLENWDNKVFTGVRKVTDENEVNKWLGVGNDYKEQGPWTAKAPVATPKRLPLAPVIDEPVGAAPTAAPVARVVSAEDAQKIAQLKSRIDRDPVVRIGSENYGILASGSRTPEALAKRGRDGIEPPKLRTAEDRLEDIKDATDEVTNAEESLADAIRRGDLEPEDIAGLRAEVTDAKADLRLARKPLSKEAKENAPWVEEFNKFVARHDVQRQKDIKELAELEAKQAPPTAAPVARNILPSVEEATTGKVRLFHGTPNVFESFELGRSGSGMYGPGIYFTADPSIAAGYALKGPTRASRSPVPDWINRSFMDRFGDAPIAEVQDIGGEKFVTISSAGWRERAKEIGLEFAGESGFQSLWRIPASRPGFEAAPNIQAVTLHLNKVLDIDAPADKELLKSLRRWEPVDELNLSNESIELLEGKVGSETNKEVYRLMLQMADPSDPKMDVAERLSALGYDGITHIGGGITRNPAHRVIIAIGDEFASVEKAIQPAPSRLPGELTPTAAPVAEIAPYIPSEVDDPVRWATGLTGFDVIGGALDEGSVRVVFQAEWDRKIVNALNEVHDLKLEPLDFTSEKAFRNLKASNPEHVHWSPECKNVSACKVRKGLSKNDVAVGKASVRLINEIRPPTLSIENVPLYTETVLYDDIIEALNKAGYNHSTDMVQASDYGAAQSRTRMIIRAVRKDYGDLPPLPEKTGSSDWYPLLKDLIDAEEKIPISNPRAFPSDTPGKMNDELDRIHKMVAKGTLDETKPIFTTGQSAGPGVANAKNSGGLGPTLTVSGKPRIIIPGPNGLVDAEVVAVTPEMLKKYMGLPDSFQLPLQRTLAKKVLGNGIHGDVTRNFIQPLINISKAKRGRIPPAPVARAAEEVPAPMRVNLQGEMQELFNNRVKPRATAAVERQTREASEGVPVEYPETATMNQGGKPPDSRSIDLSEAIFEEPKGPSLPFIQKIAEKYKQFNESWVDQRYRINKMTGDYKKRQKDLGEEFDVTYDAESWLAAEPGAPAAGKDRAEAVLKAALVPLKKLGIHQAHLRNYLAYMNMLDITKLPRLKGRLIAPGIRNKAELERRIAMQKAEIISEFGEKGYKQLEESANQITSLYRFYLEQSAVAGLIDPKLANKLIHQHPNYNPIVYFDKEVHAQFAKGVQKKETVTRNSLYRLSEHGSEAARMDPLALVTRFAIQSEMLIARNTSVKAIIKVGLKDPDFGAQFIKVSPSEVKLIELVREGAESSDNLPASVIKHYRKRKGDIPDTISYYENGKQVNYAFPEELKKAIGDFEQLNLGTLDEWITRFQHYPRLFLTGANPKFFAVNFLIDTLLSAPLQGVMPWRTAAALYKNLRALFRDDPVLQDMIRRGGSVGGFAVQTPEQILRAANKRGDLVLYDNKSWTQIFSNPIASLEKLGGAIEMAPRRAIYELKLSQGESHVRAVLAARRITADFQRMGTSMRLANRLYLYLNASKEGFLLPFRAFRDTRTAKVALAGFQAVSLAAFMNNRQYPEYYDIPLWERLTQLFIMIPSNERDDFGNIKPHRITLIPNMRQFALFHGPLIAFAEKIDGYDPELMNSAGIIFEASNPLGGWDPIPTFALNKMVEVQNNKDYFRDKPIVPNELINLPKEQQYNEYTSLPAMRLGKIFKQSPMKLDHLMNTGLLKEIFLGADYALNFLEDDDPEALEALEALQRIRDFSHRDDITIDSNLFLRGLSPELRKRVEELDRRPEQQLPFMTSFMRTFYRTHGGDLYRSSLRRAEGEFQISEEQTRAVSKQFGFYGDELHALQEGLDAELGSRKITPKNWRLARAQNGLNWKGLVLALKRQYPQAAQIKDPNNRVEFENYVASLGGLMEDRRTKAEILLAGFNAIYPEELEGGIQDMEKFFNERDSYRKNLSPEDMQAMDNLRFSKMTEVEETYELHLLTAKPYWELEDTYYAIMGEDGAKAKEAEQALEQARLLGNTMYIDSAKNNKWLRKKDSWVSKQKILLREKSPRLDATLRVWGYVDTSKTSEAENIFNDINRTLVPQ